MRKTVSIILAALLLCAFAACGSSQSGTTAADNANFIEVPNVQGQTLTDARSTLSDAGFGLVVSNYDGAEIAPERILVSAQSPDAGSSADPEKAVTLSCLKKCLVYLDLTSDFNLFLSTYDLEIYFDEQKIGTIPNGEKFSLLIDTLEGNHTLYAYKAGDNNISASQKIDIAKDVTFSSRIIHGGSITFSDIATADGVALASLQVPDVTGMVLEEAKSALSAQGFGNVKEEPYGEIWNTANWLVVDQGIAPGSVVNSNEFLQLDCISLDDYFNTAYSGKTLLEVQELAAGNGFSLTLEDADSYEDLTAAVSSWTADEQAAWTVSRARQGTGKSAVVYIVNTDENSAPVTEEDTVTEEESTPEPTAEPEAVSVPEPTTKPASPKHPASYHSSNDRDIAKEGSSGVYAYKSRGMSYTIYFIIDMDEGYVYRFCEGNGDALCDKVKIDGGTLNDLVIITYHDGGSMWQNAFCFSWTKQPDKLMYQDQNYDSYEYFTTDLDAALELRDTKTIINY